MESGIEALNKIKETRDRFLAMQKLSKEIFNETITRINELKQFHEDVASNELLLQKKKCTISVLEANNHMLDKRITTLETILKEKKECVVEQEDLLKIDQQDILSARSSHCDRVYKYIDKIQSKPELSICTEENNSRELDDLNKQVQNHENELRALNENILEKESALKDIQSLINIQQEEEFKYQQFLESRKQTLKNLMQQVKLLKFNQRKYQLNHTIESLYQQNSNRYFHLDENNQESKNGETSNYFTSSTTAGNSKQSDALNKVKNWCTIKNERSNFKSSVREVNQTFIANEEEFSENTVKRCKVSEEMLASANRPASNITNSSIEDCRIKAIHGVMFLILIIVLLGITFYNIYFLNRSLKIIEENLSRRNLFFRRS